MPRVCQRRLLRPRICEEIRVADTSSGNDLRRHMDFRLHGLERTGWQFLRPRSEVEFADSATPTVIEFWLRHTISVGRHAEQTGSHRRERSHGDERRAANRTAASILYHHRGTTYKSTLLLEERDAIRLADPTRLLNWLWDGGGRRRWRRMARHRGLSHSLFAALDRRVAVLPEAEGREEAVNTLVVYAPVVLAIIFMLIVYGWLKSKEKR